MKLLFVVAILALVALSTAKPQLPIPYPNPDSFPNGCVYIEGRCYIACEEGTHEYMTFCAEKMPEATCDQPNPVLESGELCDYSDCYCNAPTVRDTASGKCVPLDQCLKNKQE